MDELLVDYLDECGRRGIHGEVRAIDERREEFVARNGSVESEGVTNDAVVSLAVSDGAQWAVLAGGVDVDVRTVVAEGLALLRSTSGRDAPKESPVTARPGRGDAPDRREWPGRTVAGLDSLHDKLVAASVFPGSRECEVRALQLCRTVQHATPQRSQTFPTTHGSLVLRATRTGADGETAHVDRAESGPDLGWLLERFDDLMLTSARQQLLAPALAPAAALPGQVVLAGSVAAQLVCLLGEALSAEAVERGSSRLAGRLGLQVGARSVTVIDDPLYGTGPRHLPFDDEGTAAAARALIERGRLRGFLGSRIQAAEVEGSVPGNARQPDVTSAPRPGASNLFIVPASSPLRLDGPTLRITQTHGMHLANGITGEFATGATGLVEDGGGNVWHVTGLSVAGNVLDLLQNIAGMGSTLSWADDAESSFGSPDLHVTGLTIGR
ncbi:MAG: Peptidase PmbA [Streptosporangiaceae bacterium]|jgi:predicted Zn-dependent protease|nr:Peptidase PmbA [Streptosporangiaceae bacterium]